MSTFHEVLDIIGVNKDDWEKFGDEWRKSGKDCPGQAKAKTEKNNIILPISHFKF